MREELIGSLQTIEMKVALWVAGDLAAWFFHAELNVGIDQLRIAQGHSPLVPRQVLSDHPLSPWHAAALTAWLEGRTTVELDA